MDYPFFSSSLKPDPHTLQVAFHGVRGSYPVAGEVYNRFGGHTPCVEIWLGMRRIILDAGTGLTNIVITDETPTDILLSHLHLDHIQGLPFLKTHGDDTSRPLVRTWCGTQNGENAQKALTRIFSPPLFPVGLSQMRPHFEHHGFHAGCDLILPDGLHIKTHFLNHPDGACGYRLTLGKASICYLCDMEHTAPWPDPALVRFIEGADLLIYDGMFDVSEYRACEGWGHSTWMAGLTLAQAAHVKNYAVFHLHPDHDDNLLEERERTLKKYTDAYNLNAFIAREGMTHIYSAD